MGRKKSNNNCLLWCDWLFQLSTHLYFSLMVTLMTMWWQIVMSLLVKHSNHLHEHHVTSSSQESHWNFIEKSVKRRMQKNNTRKNIINFIFPSCQSSVTFKYFYRKIIKFILYFYQFYFFHHYYFIIIFQRYRTLD